MRQKSVRLWRGLSALSSDPGGIFRGFPRYDFHPEILVSVRQAAWLHGFFQLRAACINSGGASS